MRTCRDLDRYLDGRLDASRRAAFEEHLATCPRCAASVAQWKRTADDLKAWSETVDVRHADQAAADRLVARATSRQVQPPSPLVPRWPRLALGGLVAAGLAALAIFFVIRAQTPSSKKAPPGTSQNQPSIAKGRAETTGPWQRLAAQRRTVRWRHGAITLALAPGAQAQVRLESDIVHVRLMAGTLAALVQHGARTGRHVPHMAYGAPGGYGTPSSVKHLLVEAAHFQIQDLGTRFSVRLEPNAGLSVVVADGTVQVSRARHSERPTPRQWSLSAGRALRIRLTRPPGNATDTQASTEPKTQNLAVEYAVTKKEARQLDSLLAGPSNAASQARTTNRPSANDSPNRQGATGRRTSPPVEDALTKARRMILVGNLSRAATILTAHLQSHPTDGRSWSMLGDCRRKQGRWKEAMDAYRKTARVGTPMARQRARFLAATIAQDRLGRCRQALVFFDAFLSHSGAATLRPEAKVRKAGCLARLGKKSAAIELLHDVQRSYRGTSAALHAQRMLHKLGAQ